MGVRRLIFTLVAVVAFQARPSAAAEVAITLDDLPYVMPSRTAPEAGLEQVTAIIHAMAQHDIKAVGFVTGEQVTAKALPALRAFAQAGHGVGNHSWSHPDIGTLNARQFRRELRRTQTVIRDLPGAVKLFRFPYLREGETERAKTRAERVLARAGYVNVPPSIDNDDYSYNAEYLDALAAGDTAEANAVATRYLAHMKERSLHFQALGQEVLGRDPAHILLLHMNQINADHLGNLLEWYVDQGWEFVSVEEALGDPLYSAPDLYEGPRGLSQIERVLGRKSE